MAVTREGIRTREGEQDPSPVLNRDCKLAASFDQVFISEGMEVILLLHEYSERQIELIELRLRPSLSPGGWCVRLGSAAGRPDEAFRPRQ